MTVLKIFCFCFNPKTGSVVLGCLGIILSVLLIVPPCLILESHDYYFGEFIKQQKAYGGVDYDDEDIPAIKYFNKVFLASFVAYLVLFTFASILMISGIAGRKSWLLVPWLVVSFLTLLIFLILSIAAMFAIASIKALAVLVPAGVPLGFGVYFWYTVYSVFMVLRSEETAKMVRSAIRPESSLNSTSAGNGNNLTSSSTVETEETTDLCIAQPQSSTTASSQPESQHSQQPLRPNSIPISQSTPSFAHVKETIQRAVGGTPPPPYEAVAVDIDKEEEALRAGIKKSALALKARLEQPPLSKNASVDSNGTTSDDISACTTQPMDAVANGGSSSGSASDEPLNLLDSISFSSSNHENSLVNTEAVVASNTIITTADVTKC